MQRSSRQKAPIWLLVVALLSSAEFPSLLLAGTNAWGIDYSNPGKYLVSGEQTTLTREDWEAISPELPFAPIGLPELGKLYAWKRTWFKSVSGGGKFVGKSTAQDLIRKRTLTGCHDHGLILVAVLRRLGVPAVFVDATGIQWTLEYPERTRSFRGHVFVEAYLQNAWILLDSVSGEFIPNYDPSNPVIPIGKPNDEKGFCVLFKGIDPADYGVARIEELNRAQADFARKMRSEVPNFRYPPYVIQRLP